MRRPIIIFMLTMPLSRSMRPRPGGCSQLPARSRCPLRATPPIFHLLSRPHQLTSTRLFSAAEKTARRSTTNGEDDLLDPYVILRNLTNQNAPTIPLPTHYSPTSLETFSKCPQAFFFLYILKLTPDPPMTPQLARGIICHTALEDLYDLSPDDRSLVNLENLFRREWNRLRGERKENAPIATDDGEESNYDALFRDVAGYDIDSEIDWGKSSLDLLKNYYDLEDPRTKNPVAREMWVQARFESLESNESSDFIVRGKIDRIDVLPTSSDKIQLQIIDYKTGKKPWFKYSRKVNERIAHEQFWKMKIYSLVLWKMIQQTGKESEHPQIEKYKYGMPWLLRQRLAMANAQSSQSKWSNILEINSLRLTYLTSHPDDTSTAGSSVSTNTRRTGKATYLDFSLEPPFEFQSFLEQTELEIRTIGHGIETLVSKQSPHAFKHCEWKYCSCHELRKKFKPGSVFQSADYV